MMVLSAYPLLVYVLNFRVWSKRGGECKRHFSLRSIVDRTVYIFVWLLLFVVVLPRLGPKDRGLSKQNKFDYRSKNGRFYTLFRLANGQTD